MQELQPPIFINDIRIGEPVTALTDFLVSAVCFYAFYQLKGNDETRSRVFFRYYFLFLGLATFWGGLVTHAFIYTLSQPWKVPGWIMSTWAVSLLALAMVRYHKQIVGQYSNAIITIILIELFIMMSFIVYTVEFKGAGAHSAFGLILVVGSLSIISYAKFKDRGSLWMLSGVGTFVLSGITFTLNLSMHTWFNHVDLTHVLLAVAACFIYVAVEKMTGAASTIQ